MIDQIAGQDRRGLLRGGIDRRKPSYALTSASLNIVGAGDGDNLGITPSPCCASST